MTTELTDKTLNAGLKTSTELPVQRPERSPIEIADELARLFEILESNLLAYDIEAEFGRAELIAELEESDKRFHDLLAACNHYIAAVGRGKDELQYHIFLTAVEAAKQAALFGVGK